MMLSVLVGVIVVIVACVEWFDKSFTVIHAVAILTLIAGISILIAGFGDRAGRYTRL